MKKVAVVILNYNGRNFLEKFLPSVVRFSENAEIFVADNGSTDDSVTFLKQNFLPVKIIQLPHNQGFAGGYNTALKQISAEYFVLLNSDVEVTENWILPVIALMETNSTIAACQPKIRSFHTGGVPQKNEFEYAGAAGGFIDYLGYPFCRGRIFDVVEEDLGQYDDNREIFWATGAAMFVRAEIFEEMGGFDADFFAHMEEIDLCWRIKNAGYQIFYCYESVVFHVGGGTLHKSNPHKTFLNYRNGLAMLYKNSPPENFIKTIFTRLVLDGISGIKLFTEGKFADVWAIIKAHFTFYAWIKNLREKRRKINPKNVSEVYQKSIVWQFFVKKIKKFSELKEI